MIGQNLNEIIDFIGGILTFRLGVLVYRLGLLFTPGACGTESKDGSDQQQPHFFAEHSRVCHIRPGAGVTTAMFVERNLNVNLAGGRMLCTTQLFCKGPKLNADSSP